MSGRPSHQEGTDTFTVTSTPVKGAKEAGEATAVSHLGCTPKKGDHRATGRMARDLEVWHMTFLSSGKYVGTDGETEAQDQPRTQRISGGWIGVEKDRREREKDGLRQ